MQRTQHRIHSPVADQKHQNRIRFEAEVPTYLQAHPSAGGAKVDYQRFRHVHMLRYNSLHINARGCCKLQGHCAPVGKQGANTRPLPPYRENSVKYGLFSFSAPTVVCVPWPG